MAGELPLQRNAAATVRMYVFAAVIGGALTPALLAGLSVMLKFELFRPAQHGGYARGPWDSLLIVGAVFGCVACGVITWMRQPKGARIAWDEWGITEWDGDGARVAIEWSQLQVNTDTITSKRITIGHQLTLSDPAGRRIDLTEGSQKVTFNDRLTSVDSLGALRSLVEKHPLGTAPLEPRSALVAALGILLGSLGYIGSFLGLLAFSAQPSEAAAVLVLLGGTLLMLRSLAFLTRARRDRTRGSVTAVELSGGESGSVTLTDGRKVDVSRHPDAGLHLRRGAAWLWSTGTLETAAMRVAREARVRSNFISGFARLLLGAAVFSCAVPVTISLIKALTQAPDERVKIVWRAEERAGGAGLDTVGRRFLVFDSGDAKLLDLDTATVIARLPTRCWSPSAVALSPTHALISCADDTTVVIALESPPRKVAAIPVAPFRALTLGKERFVVGDRSGLTAFGTVADGKITGIVQAEGDDHAQVVTLCEASDQIAFISRDGDEWKAWLATGPVTRRLREVDGRGNGLAFSPDCALLAVVEEKEVVLVDTTDGRRRDALPIGPRGIEHPAMAFSPDGTLLAISTLAELRVYDLRNRQLKLEMPLLWRRSVIVAETAWPTGLAFDGNDTLYVLSSYGGGLLRVSVR